MSESEESAQSETDTGTDDTGTDDTEAGGAGSGGDWDEESGHETRQPGADPEDEAEIEEERQRRLDPENRPDDAEVDNTPRDFDAEKGMFTDSEGYDEAEAKFPAIGEQGA